MLAKLAKVTREKRSVRIITPDAALGRRFKAALEVTGRFNPELVARRACELASIPLDTCSLVIAQVSETDPADLAAFEELLCRPGPRPPVVILSRELEEAVVRRLLKLQIADWLPTSCSDRDLVLACDHALWPAAGGSAQPGRSTAFVPAIGGAGATTLSLIAASVLAGNGDLAGCCVVDLDFQSGTVADYVEVTPALQLNDIAANPERLDSQMLEVLLARHPSGLAVLAAPPLLSGFEAVGSEVVGRLLDLASLKFRHLVIDLPRTWMPWSESVLRGSDAVYIVTEMTVAGLRKAKRLVDGLEERDITGARTHSIIVNKLSWLGMGVRKADARELLGDRLAGFVSAHPQLIREAQNRGLLPCQVRRSSRIESELKALLGRPLAASAGGA